MTHQDVCIRLSPKWAKNTVTEAVHAIEISKIAHLNFLFCITSTVPAITRLGHSWIRHVSIFRIAHVVFPFKWAILALLTLNLTWAKLTTARCKKIYNGKKIKKPVVEQRRP